MIEEALKLAAAVTDWARSRGPAAFGVAAETLAAHIGGSQQCAICPLCQALALIRGAQPEVYEHLADAASALTAAVTALVESVGSSPPPTRPRVQRIEVA